MSHSKALDDIIVIDLTQALAGPSATAILADYGATVIKVESINGSDMARHVNLHPATHEDPIIGGGSYWAINRNKIGVCIDIRSDDGKQALFRLLEKADVLVSNFRPGTTKAIGIDYESLKDRFPRLICAEIGGFAEKAHRNDAALDAIVQAASGIMECTGSPDAPAKVGFSMTDIASGLFLVQGIMFALYSRTKTGLGQNVDVRMQDAAMYFFLQETVDLLSVDDYRSTRSGTHSMIACPNGAISTKDGVVVINPGNEKLWQNFCLEVVNKPEWITGEKYSTSLSRAKNNDELLADIEAVFKTFSTEDILQKLKAAGIPASPMLSSKQAFKKAEEEKRSIVAKVSHPNMGEIGVCGYVVNMSRTPASIDRGAPALGADTREVLKQYAAYSDAEIMKSAS